MIDFIIYFFFFVLFSSSFFSKTITINKQHDYSPPTAVYICDFFLNECQLYFQCMTDIIKITSYDDHIF